jgi:hypothetical protein
MQFEGDMDKLNKFYFKSQMTFFNYFNFSFFLTMQTPILKKLLYSVFIQIPARRFIWTPL